MKPFKRLISYAKPYSRFWPGYLVLSILSVIFGVLNYSLISPLLSVLFDPSSIQHQLVLPPFELSVDYFNVVFKYYLTKYLVVFGPLSALMFVCLIIIISSFLSNATKYISQRILVDMRTYIMRRVRSDLFKKISGLNVGYFNNRNKGDIISCISSDVTEVQNGVANSFHVLFQQPILIIGYLIALFYMSPKLTVVTLFTLPISAFAIGSVTRKLKAGASRTQTLMGKIVTHFEEAISGIRIIKAFNARPFVRENFEVTNRQHMKSGKSMFNRQELASPLAEFLGITVAAAVLFYGGWLQINGKLGLDMPDFVVYIAFYWRVLEPAKAMSKAYASIQRGLASGNRLFTILDAENPIKEKENSLPVSEFKKDIKFEHVDFSYASEPILKDINIEIDKGMMVAIVGPSGAGKSTIADLIPRFYDVSGGRITLDGVDIRNYKMDDLISLMGIVTQEAILFNDTVYNNITFGKRNVSRKAVVEAAKIANAHEFIMQMDNGYDTNIGERGSNLSGGQRQRLAIARAVLKNPPVLILDEATSALDTESERLVQDALEKLMENRTSLVIAHRLSTIRRADVILVIKDGEVIEKGKHDQLIMQKGLYSHLCELQDFK